MAHTVVIQDFEGPLGLLLELVERGRLEVTAISVSHVTNGYLERVKALESTPEELSDFLQLGCRLLYIKSLALLPRENDGEQLEELTRLNDELAEYQRYRQAARELGRRASNRSWHRDVVTKLPAQDLPLPNLSLESLGAVFQQAMRRVEPAKPVGVIRRQVSQAQMEQRIKTLLADGPVALHEELERATDRLEVIVLFTALLELIKNGVARVVQNGQFEPIMIETAS